MAATSPDPHTGILQIYGGLQSSFQLLSAFGAVDTWQCAREEDALATWPFLLVFSQISGKVPVVRFRKLHMVRSRAELRKFISEAPLGLPHAKHPSLKHGAATSF